VATKRRQPQSANDEGEDDILQQLRARGDKGNSLTDRPIDGALLGMVVAAVTRKGGAIQFGTTRDGTKMSLKVWYKGFPTQDYASDVEEMETRLAWTLRIFLPKDVAWDEWRNYAENFI